MSTPKGAPKNTVVHSPLLRFRKRAHCQECSLHDACLNDKTIEIRCLIALIADCLYTTSQLNTLRGAQF